MLAAKHFSNALNVAMTMKVKDFNIYPDRIRSPHNGADTFSLTCTFAVVALKDLYKYLGDGDDEKRDFAEFYKGFIAKREIAEKNLNTIVN